jgi:hypothetical protein
MMTSFADAFKLVNVEMSQSSRKVIIQDSAVEVVVVIESCFPKEMPCVQAAISLEGTKDGKKQSDSPSPRIQELPAERRQSSGGKRQSIQSQQNSTGDTQQLK